jgi:hypothetical protein
MIKRCTCKHEYQDKKHGKGKRVHNPLRSKSPGGKLTDWRCTVCGTVRS